MAQLTLLYLEHCRQHYRKNGNLTTEFQVVKDAHRRLNRFHRDKLATEFSPRLLKGLVESMVCEGLARTTINGTIGRIRRMFRWAVSKEIVPAAVLLERIQQETSALYGR